MSQILPSGIILPSSAPAQDQAAVAAYNNLVTSANESGQSGVNPSSLAQSLQALGIDTQDANAIAGTGQELLSGQVQPLNTGSQLVQQSQPLNTGSQTLATVFNNIPQAPIQFVKPQPGQPDWMNWLILLVLAFIAIWIVVEVFR